MTDNELKIIKRSRCLIARNVIQYADVEFTESGEIYSYDVDYTKEVLSLEILEEYDERAGNDLIKDIKNAIEIANKSIKRYGKDTIELLINNKDNFIHVNYHGKEDNVCLYDFENYNTQDEFVINYIVNEFELNEIKVIRI